MAQHPFVDRSTNGCECLPSLADRDHDLDDRLDRGADHRDRAGGYKSGDQCIFVTTATCAVSTALNRRLYRKRYILMVTRRIALICETSIKYIYPQVTDLAELLARQGHLVTVFTRDNADMRSWNGGRGFAFHEISRPDALPSRLWNPFFFAQVMRRLRPFDTVITFTSPTLPIALAANRFFGTRAIHVALELHVPTDPSAKGYAIFQKALRRSAIRVFTTGHHRSRLLKKAYGLDLMPGEFLNAALAKTAAKPVNERPPVGQQVRALSGQADPIVLLYDGGLDDLNMLDHVIDAQIPMASGVALSFIGPCGAGWRARLQSAHETTGNYFYLGEIAGTRYDVVRAAMDVDLGFVLKRSSKSLPANDRLYTPNKLFDFLAAGVVPIISDQPTLRFVEREGWGYRPASLSVDGLRAFMMSLSDRRDELHQMKQRVRERFLSRYNLEVTAAPILDALS